jgi:hypothetical protein
MSLSACICRSPAAEVQMGKFRGARDPYTRYNLLFRRLACIRARTHLRVRHDFNGFLREFPRWGAFLSSLVHLSRVTPNRLANTWRALTMVNFYGRIRLFWWISFGSFLPRSTMKGSATVLPMATDETFPRIRGSLTRHTIDVSVV